MCVLNGFTLSFFAPLQLALCKYLKRNTLCTSQTLRSYRYSLPWLRYLWSRLSFAWCSRSSSAVTGAVGCGEGQTVTAFHLLRIQATAVTDAGGDCHRRQRLLYLKVSTGGEVKKEGGWGGVFEGSVFKRLWTAGVPSTCTHACFCTHMYTQRQYVMYSTTITHPFQLVCCLYWVLLVTNMVLCQHFGVMKDRCCEGAFPCQV